MNSAGCHISLLNDEPPSKNYIVSGCFASEDGEQRDELPHLSYSSSSSRASDNGDWLRSGSDDSQMATDHASPLSPSHMEFDWQTTYSTTNPKPTYHDRKHFGHQPQKRLPQPSTGTIKPPTIQEDASSSNDEDQSIPVDVAPLKRRPCSFKSTHNCNKTFSTTAHASRHSKMHTGEKCVQCSFEGCTKKFTRADNMKHHLHIHYDEAARALISARERSFSSATETSVPSAGVNKQDARTDHQEFHPIGGSGQYISYSACKDLKKSSGTSRVGNSNALGLESARRPRPAGLDALLFAIEFKI